MAPTVKAIAPYVEMTPEREKKVDEFITAFESRYDPLPKLYKAFKDADKPDQDTPHTPSRAYAYGFLQARSWDVKKALEMADFVVKQRALDKIDDINMFPPAFATRGFDQEAVPEFIGFKEPRAPARIDQIAAGVDQYFSCGLHYWNKQGLPVMYMMIGAVDEEGLLKKLDKLCNVGETRDEVMWEFVSHSLKVGEDIMRYQQHLAETGKLEGVDTSAGILRSFDIIIDAKGLNYKMLWKPALDLFQNAIKRIFTYNPDCVHRIMVVNCPKMVMFAYNIVKGVLDEGVRKKVSFFYPNETTAALEQIIEKKHIPTFLGGECKCEFNCVGSFDPDHPSERDVVLDDSDDIVTENITLKAGKRFCKTFVLKKADKVIWEFTSTDKTDVAFSIYFVPKAKTGDINWDKTKDKELKTYLDRQDKPTQGSDMFTAAEDGTLVLVWDNKHSWFNSKKVQMRVFKEAADGHVSPKADAKTESNSASKESDAHSPISE